MSDETFNQDDMRLQIARDLTSIAEMFVKLKGEAVNRAGDPDIPGGAAMVLLANGADVEAWSYYRMSAIFGRLDMDAETRQEIEKFGIEPPLSFLASWADIVREERGGEPSGRRARIADEIRYLRASLDWMLAVDEDGAPWWLPVEDFATRLAQVRRTMENVLRDGDRREYTRVRCISEDCPDQRRLYRQYGGTVARDRYICPTCGEEYNASQFNQAKAQNLADQGADRFVLVADAVDASEVPKATVKSWMNRLNVRTVCDLRTKRVMVWWPDIRERAQDRRIEILKKRVS
ncbi:MAG: hypothetical protein PGN07_04725 [Aeromicrobium erythreum]